MFDYLFDDIKIKKLSFIDLFKLAAIIFLKDFKRFLLFTFVIFGPIFFLGGIFLLFFILLNTGLNYNIIYDTIFSNLLITIPTVFPFCIFYIATLHLLCSDIINEQKPSIKSTLKTLFKKFLKLISVTIAQFLIMCIFIFICIVLFMVVVAIELRYQTSIVFIIAGLIVVLTLLTCLNAVLAMILNIVSTTDLKLINSFSYSFKLIRGNFLLILLLTIFISIIGILILFTKPYLYVFWIIIYYTVLCFLALYFIVVLSLKFINIKFVFENKKE